MKLEEKIIKLRKRNAWSQEELAEKLDVTRQTVSKWESGLSVPDAEMLMTISEILETPVSEILGESIEEKEKNDLKVISEKLEVINEHLAMKQKQKRKMLVNTLIIVDVCLIILFGFGPPGSSDEARGDFHFHRQNIEMHNFRQEKS